MKGILEFNLPEDQSDFDVASKGMSWRNVVWEIDQHMRDVIKYQPITDEQSTLLQGIKTELRDIIHSKGLNLEM